MPMHILVPIRAISSTRTGLVPDFGGQFCPIFGQEKYEFLYRTIRKWFDENSLNQLYIHIIVVVIRYIYLFSNFILSLTNVYSMWCTLSFIIII